MRVLISKDGNGVVFPHVSWSMASDAQLLAHYERIVFPGSCGRFEIHRVKSENEAFLINKARQISFWFAAEIRARFALMLATRFPPYVETPKHDPEAMIQTFELWS